MKTPRQNIDWFVATSDGSSDGARQIQRCDFPDDDSAPVFRDDEAAIRHVIARAKQGDKAAIAALWEVLDYDGLVNRILWCEAMNWKGANVAAYPKATQ